MLFDAGNILSIEVEKSMIFGNRRILQVFGSEFLIVPRQLRFINLSIFSIPMSLLTISELFISLLFSVKLSILTGFSSSLKGDDRFDWLGTDRQCHIKCGPSG